MRPKPAAKEKLAVLKYGTIFATHPLTDRLTRALTFIPYKSEQSRFDNSAINNQRRFPVSSGNAFFV